MVGFVGGTGPATGAPQHLQWCGLACRGRPPASRSPRVPEIPPGLAPHLSDVGFRGHWVGVTVDGEDDSRQASHISTCNHVLLEKEGERLVQVIPGVWRAPG